MTFEPLKFNDAYQISTEYPYQVVTREGKNVSESINNVGYVQITIDGITTGKHRLVAIQWIPNPDKLPEVNHKDHDKLNNSVENLEWCTVSDNRRDRRQYCKQPIEYVDEIPETAVELVEYKGFEYDRYWYDYDTERLIMHSRNRYPLRGLGSKSRYHFVNITDTTNSVVILDSTGRQHTISMNKLRNEMTNRIDRI